MIDTIDFSQMTDSEIIAEFREQHAASGYSTVDIANARPGLPAKSTTHRIFGRQQRVLSSAVMKHLRLMGVLGWLVVDRKELWELEREVRRLRALEPREREKEGEKS